MDPITSGIVGTLLLLAVIFLFRIPVAFAMAIIGFGGFASVLNWNAATGMLGTELWNVFSRYGLTVIPLFILMGQICFHSGVNERLYKSAYAWMGEIRGGLAMTTILACAGFAAICGSNSATAATMSTVALPEMKKFKYNSILSTGAVAAGATLGVIIPPSVVLIIIGLQTSQSIAQLFMGSIVPGVLLTALFMGTVWFLCRKHPDWGPAGPKTTFKEKLASLPGSIEMIILFILVMGGLFLGFFTPTEAGAAGAALALIIATLSGKMTFRKFWLAVNDSLKISCMIMVIIFGAVIFGRFLAITRLPFEAASAVAALPIPPMVIILIICLIYVIGGMVMDALALLLVTIPIFFPVVTAMGYDPLWFGVLITVVTTLGAITPPVGVNLFIVASMAKDVPMTDVFKGVTYFMLAYCLCAALIMLFPGIVTFVPGLMQ
ncbi:TRAP transporter large permease [Pseudodesulfovibrio piezophilus]|uniref:TRAP dicarboxylate transporter, DctM subunit n=1 Tax=Pseudodesulfovibrio piezophilus (strain DSM 21447 / JCM 15486 / C1TLV30) TaxID=1322246 RepID=M1WS17_PSEP2|nr:TRAP transporter large permease [Pseudodesulfovibrio piezophilus]CCH49894.1 TRAP dicarboxylate transporter, DctM subunit [Pseudodesulfovibrio piezophilus C1TLV30]